MAEIIRNCFMLTAEIILTSKLSKSKMISTLYCALSRVCLHFGFVSCKDITKCKYFATAKYIIMGKIKVLALLPCSFSYHLMKQLNMLAAVKINEAVGKKIFKGLKDKVCGL